MSKFPYHFHQKSSWLLLIVLDIDQLIYLFKIPDPLPESGCVRLEEIVCEGNEIDRDTISRFVQVANQRKIPSGTSVFSSLLEVQGKLRTDMDITHLPVDSKVSRASIW